MKQLVLTDEQAKLVAASRKPVSVVDSRGNSLGTITPAWTEADVVEAKRRLASEQPRYTTAQVLEHLRSLEKQ